MGSSVKIRLPSVLKSWISQAYIGFRSRGRKKLCKACSDCHFPFNSHEATVTRRGNAVSTHEKDPRLSCEFVIKETEACYHPHVGC